VVERRKKTKKNSTWMKKSNQRKNGVNGKGKIVGSGGEGHSLAPGLK